MKDFTQQALVSHTSMTKSQKVSTSKGLLIQMLLIDLQKAFDRIDYNILIKKRFTDETIKWYTSYISNRKFIISMENANLDKVSITCGVPQS